MTRPIPLRAALLAAILATPAAAQAPAYTGSMEPCLAPHGDRALYHAGLLSTGWTDVSDARREVAVGMIADAFLPVTGPLGEPWADVIAHRARSHAFWTDLARGRTLMEREGWVLLLAGFRDDNGEMRVECWSAGPQSPATDGFFALAGQMMQGDGVQMTALGIAPDGSHPATELLVSRLVPPVPPDPPLLATDGLRTRITFLLPAGDP